MVSCTIRCGELENPGCEVGNLGNELQNLGSELLMQVVNMVIPKTGQSRL